MVCIEWMYPAATSADNNQKAEFRILSARPTHSTEQCTIHSVRQRYCTENVQTEYENLYDIVQGCCHHYANVYECFA